MCTSHGSFVGSRAFWVGCCQFAGVLVISGCLGGCCERHCPCNPEDVLKAFRVSPTSLSWGTCLYQLSHLTGSEELLLFFFLVEVMCVVCLCGICVWWFIWVCRPALCSWSSFSTQCFFNYKIKLLKKIWGRKHASFGNRTCTPSMRTWAGIPRTRIKSWTELYVPVTPALGQRQGMRRARWPASSAKMQVSHSVRDRLQVERQWVTEDAWFLWLACTHVSTHIGTLVWQLVVSPKPDQPNKKTTKQHNKIFAKPNKASHGLGSRRGSAFSQRTWIA